MAINRYQPRNHFLAEFPGSLLQRLSLGIIQSYREAADFCAENYDPPEDHDLRGHVRRANIERMVRQAVQTYGNGARVAPTPNRIKSAFHRRVVVGGIVLTVSSVSDPKQLTREALFRSQYARDPQRHLFNDEMEISTGPEALYAILLHGPQKSGLDCPRFLQIGFPDRACKKYLDSIDLFSLFPHLVSLEEADVTTGVRPRLRPGVAKRKKEEE